MLLATGAINLRSRMCGPQVRFCERHGGASPRAYSTATLGRGCFRESNRKRPDPFMNCMLTIVVILLVVPTGWADVREKHRDIARRQSDRIMLVGHGDVTEQADRGQVRLRVVTKKSKLQNALQANRNLRNEMAARLQSAGFKAEDFKTSRFSSTPRETLIGTTHRSMRSSTS